MEERKQKDKQEVIYPKSNLLIASKYRSTLEENKIIAIALERLYRGNYYEDPDTKALVCNFTSSELSILLNARGGTFYKSLDLLADKMTGRNIGWKNPNKTQFDYVNVIARASYKDNKFQVRFNSELKNFLKDLHENFTILPLSKMLGFSSVYGFRLYELILSECYPDNKRRNVQYSGNNQFHIFYGLSELKLMLGVVNANEDGVKQVLNANKQNPDYDAAVRAAKDQLYPKWYDFRRYVIERGIQEISNKTSMQIQYDVEKGGQGNKVQKILFFVNVGQEKISSLAVDNRQEIIEAEFVPVETKTTNKLQRTKPSLAEMLKIRSKIIERVSEVKEDVSENEAKKIADACDYDLERFNVQMDALENKQETVKRPVAWLIKAIKEGYVHKYERKGKKMGEGEHDSLCTKILSRLLSVDCSFTENEAEKIAETGNYDEMVIMPYLDHAVGKAKRGECSNVVGFTITAIKESYRLPEKPVKEDVMINGMSIDELEIEILRNQIK